VHHFWCCELNGMATMSGWRDAAGDVTAKADNANDANGGGHHLTNPSGLTEKNGLGSN